jgi:signal transduction histidine kinase
MDPSPGRGVTFLPCIGARWYLRGIDPHPARSNPRPFSLLPEVLMPARGFFERRLLITLALFSLLPTLALLGLGAWSISEAVLITGAPAAWERAADTGGALIRAAETSGDPALIEAAALHRDELSASLIQARRWEFLLTRFLAVLPLLTLALAALLGWLALRAARGIARGMTAPIRELVEWARRVARGEPLPDTPAGGTDVRDEFGVLREAFRAMADEVAASRRRALEAERMRTWMSMARQVAHELKNPLTPMRLAVHTLRRDAGNASPAHREALDVIAAEASRLDEMARTFAQFGRLPEGPPSEIDLGEMLGYLLRSHLPEGVAHRMLAPVDLPRIQGHYDALSRAFANLILNAADAVEGREGSITVKIRPLPERGAVEVRVLDNGPGIAPEHMERIWEPDFSTKTRGTGLGLALVRQAAHAHGGGAWARNLVEGGAEFRVVLPISYQPSVIGHRSEGEATRIGNAAAEPTASGDALSATELFGRQGYNADGADG